jgi:hypothetical protein
LRGRERTSADGVRLDVAPTDARGLSQAALGAHERIVDRRVEIGVSRFRVLGRNDDLVTGLNDVDPRMECVSTLHDVMASNRDVSFSTCFST